MSSRKLETEDVGYDVEAVRCPYCKNSYTHVTHVGTLLGSNPHEATGPYDGTDVTGFTRARRSAVEIVFECETCPNLFALVIQQHKGHNFVEIDTSMGRKKTPQTHGDLNDGTI